MKLWISAELDGDVAAKHQSAWKPVQDAVNKRVKERKFTSFWTKWDFISVIMSDPDFYKEVAKKTKKDKSLEFRLKIDHGKFLKATPEQATALLLDALGRSVDMMAKMDVTEEDVTFLKSTLAEVAREL